VYNFDYNFEMIRVGGLGGCQADLRHLPIGTSKLDGIWCQATLTHIPREQAHLAFMEFSRVLKSSGILYVGFGLSSVKSTEEIYVEDYRLPRKIVYYSIDEVQNLSKNVELTLETLEIFPSPFGSDRKWVGMFFRKGANNEEMERA